MSERFKIGDRVTDCAGQTFVIPDIDANKPPWCYPGGCVMGCGDDDCTEWTVYAYGSHFHVSDCRLTRAGECMQRPDEEEFWCKYDGSGHSCYCPKNSKSQR